VAFKDSELGLVRLRAFGVFNLQVMQPVLFINSLVGTRGMYTTGEIEGYLNRVIVSRFNDYMGETLDSILAFERISATSVSDLPICISMQLLPRPRFSRPLTTGAVWEFSRI